MIDEHDGKAKIRILALVSLASFMVALDALVVNTALDLIRRDLGASIEELEWTVNAYNLSFAVLLLTGAALGDRFGRRRIFAAGLILFSAASALCAVSTGVAFLIGARAVQGAGAALVMPQAMAMLSAAFPGEKRAKALGIFSGVTGLALIAGPVAGGAVAEGLAWQWIFWMNVPAGLAAIALVPAFLTESRGPPTGLDIRGLVLVTAASFALAWPLIRGNRVGWSSPEIIAGLIMFIALASSFLAWEWRAIAPMVPLRLFRSRGLSSGMAASFLLYASLYSVLFILPQFLQTALGLGPLGSGMRLLPWTATLLVFAPVGGSLVNRFGERNLVVLGLLMQASGLAWIGLTTAPDIAFANLIGPLMTAGAGVSIAMPAVQNAVLGAVAPAEIGKASGTFNMSRFLGGVFGIALIVAVFSGTGSVNSVEAFALGFRAAITVSAGLSLIGTMIAFALPDRRKTVTASAKAKA
jgi:EmrB/QacA subfamily drug resistance transporter